MAEKHRPTLLYGHCAIKESLNECVTGFVCQKNDSWDCGSQGKTTSSLYLNDCGWPDTTMAATANAVSTLELGCLSQKVPTPRTVVPLELSCVRVGAPSVSSGRRGITFLPDQFLTQTNAENGNKRRDGEEQSRAEGRKQQQLQTEGRPREGGPLWDHCSPWCHGNTGGLSGAW